MTLGMASDLTVMKNGNSMTLMFPLLEILYQQQLSAATRQRARCAKCLDWIVFTGSVNVSRWRRL